MNDLIGGQLLKNGERTRKFKIEQLKHNIWKLMQGNP